MNATKNSTTSYLQSSKEINKKEEFFRKEKKGGAAAEIWYEFNLVEALMKGIVASTMILFASVPKF